MSEVMTNVATSMTVVMTGAELKACLETIGWTVHQTEHRLEVPGNTIQRMIHDRKEIPAALARWARKMALMIERIGTPTLG